VYDLEYGLFSVGYDALHFSGSVVLGVGVVEVDVFIKVFLSESAFNVHSH